MTMTILHVLEKHGHGEQQQDLEETTIRDRFPGIFDVYCEGQERFGTGVVLYAPQNRLDAAFLAERTLREVGDQGILEMVTMLRELTKDGNHVPVMFMYQCGHLSGYVVTAAYGATDADTRTMVVSEVYGALETVATLVGNSGPGPSVPEPWEFDM